MSSNPTPSPTTALTEIQSRIELLVTKAARATTTAADLAVEREDTLYAAEENMRLAREYNALLPDELRATYYNSGVHLEYRCGQATECNGLSWTVTNLDVPLDCPGCGQRGFLVTRSL